MASRGESENRKKIESMEQIQDDVLYDFKGLPEDEVNPWTLKENRKPNLLFLYLVHNPAYSYVNVGDQLYVSIGDRRRPVEVLPSGMLMTSEGEFTSLSAAAKAFDLQRRGTPNGWEKVIMPNSIQPHLHGDSLGKVFEDKWKELDVPFDQLQSEQYLFDELCRMGREAEARRVWAPKPPPKVTTPRSHVTGRSARRSRTTTTTGTRSGGRSKETEQGGSGRLW